MYGKKGKLTLIWFLFVALVLFSGFKVGAQEQKPRVILSMKTEKEVRILQGEKWVAERLPVENSEEVGSQAMLIYNITYSNKGEGEARDISVVDPIPAGTVYILGSASGEGSDMTYSIDGGLIYQEPPVQYVIKKADGTQEKKIAPPEMYTHIKWLVKGPVQPGKDGQVSFKARVL